MTPEQSAALRRPFPAEAIRKLPRVTCKACRDNKGSCGEHKKRQCPQCGNYTSTAHMHLDYVGHAETTARLLEVDPCWNWEPTAWTEYGEPRTDKNGGMWIKLTVCGVTRLGYGHPDGKTGPDAIKETIGDAIRNAAMRFGVAIDLWGATYIEDTSNHPVSSPPANQPNNVDEQEAKVAELTKACGFAETKADIRKLWNEARDAQLSDEPLRQLMLERLDALPEHLTEPPTSTESAVTPLPDTDNARALAEAAAASWEPVTAAITATTEDGQESLL